MSHLSEAFCFPVKHAVQTILDRTDPWYEEARNRDYKAYSKEFATIRVGLPRRSGNSHLALELLREFPNSALIVPTESHKNAIVRSSPENKDIGKRMFNPSGLFFFMRGNRKIDTKIEILIIDTASCSVYSKRFIEESIYSKDLDLRAFVLVG